MRTISMSQLHDLSKKLGRDELILDVRRPDEYADGHVPGSRNISHDEILPHAEELKKYKTVYVYCRSGGRVQMACHELSHLGANNLVAIAAGGMPDWIAQGFPVER